MEFYSGFKEEIMWADRFTLFLIVQYIIISGLTLYEGSFFKSLYWIGATILIIGIFYMK